MNPKSNDCEANASSNAPLHRCTEYKFALLNVISRKNADYVLEYATTDSEKTTKRAFAKEFFKKSPTAKQIFKWHKKFKNKSCSCRVNGSGRPATS